MTPCDSYGNTGASGGRFAAELVPEDDEAVPATPCQVTESTTGQLQELTLQNRTSATGSEPSKGLPGELILAASPCWRRYVGEASAQMWGDV